MLTREMYWASKDPRLKELLTLNLPDGTGLPDLAARAARGAELDALGLIVDRQIMFWGWDPVLVMADRASLGLPWVPNAFQGNLERDTDMDKPFQRSIKVSLDPADYPPVEIAPVPKPSPGPVGKFIGNGIYGFNMSECRNPTTGGWLWDEGDSQKAPDGVTVYWHNGYGPLGIPAQQWETQEARAKRIADEKTAVPV